MENRWGEIALEEIVSEEDLEKIKNIVFNLSESSAQVKADTNAFLDRLFKNFKTIINKNGMDPMALDNTTLNLMYAGTMKLTSGRLQNISTIKRYDNVVTTYSANTVSFLLPLHFRTLVCTYEYITTVLLLSISGDVKVKIDNVKLNVTIRFNRDTSTLSMGALSLGDSGTITVTFSGNGLVDWITNAMTSVITTVLHPFLIGIVESYVRSEATNIIKEVNKHIQD